MTQASSDNKLLIFAFHKKNEGSPWQFCHLDYIEQFTADILLASGCDNVAANALSRVEELQLITDYAKLAAPQSVDEELEMLKQENIGLRLKRFQVPGPAYKLWWSTGIIRPYFSH